MKNSFLFLVSIFMAFFSTVYTQEPESKSDNTPRLVPYNYQGKNTFNLYKDITDLPDFYRIEQNSVSWETISPLDYYILQFVVAETSGFMWILAGTLGVALIGAADEEHAIDTGLYIIYASYSFGVANGVFRMGRKAKKKGSYEWSLIGATAGMGLGIIAAHSESFRPFDNYNRKETNIIFASIVFLPTICSMAAYNMKLEPKYPNRFKETDYSPEISVGQLGYYQDACGGLGVKMYLLSCRF